MFSIFVYGACVSKTAVIRAIKGCLGIKTNVLSGGLLLNDDDRQSDRAIAVSSIELKREPKRDRSLFTKIF